MEAALCFGWVDSTKKKLSETETVQRLSPRSKKSNWTELNKGRVRRLERLNLVTDAGRSVFSNIDKSSFLIDSEIKERIADDSVLVEKFAELPELYIRIRIDTIQSVRDDCETYEKRLNEFLAALRTGKMIGQWRDSGHLWAIK